MSELVAGLSLEGTPPEPRASLFILRHAIARVWLGGAVICPDVRYASIAWRRAARLDRRFARPETWRDVIEQFRLGLPTTALPETSPIARLLSAPDVLTLSVTHVQTAPVRPATPGETVTRLDRQLLAAVASLT
jgi:hypothetical protein